VPWHCLSNWQSDRRLHSPEEPPNPEEEPPNPEEEPPNPEDELPNPEDAPPNPEVEPLNPCEPLEPEAKETPPPPCRGCLLVSGEHPADRASPVYPGGNEHSTWPSPLFSQRAPGPQGLGEQGESAPNCGEESTERTGRQRRRGGQAIPRRLWCYWRLTKPVLTNLGKLGFLELLETLLPL